MSGYPVMEAERALATADQLGEGPLWSPGEQSLYWVDIYGQRIHRLHPATSEHQVFEPVVRVTALGLRASGGLVVTTDKAFTGWDPKAQTLVPLAAPEGVAPAVRFNDGAVDHMGRFWAGTMNEEDGERPDGCLYRLDADGELRMMGTNYTITNGIGWSPDNTRMYLTDSARRVIWVYDYDHTSGSISNQRPFVRVPEEEGVPDGLTVDGQGSVWSAHWGGWRVTRYDPDGRVTFEVRLPVQNVTSCAFGGKNLDELYITTAWLTLTEGERKAQPQAGDLFRAKVGVRGIEEPSFAG